MNFFTFTKLVRTLLLVAALAAGAFAQGDTAIVPFVVNVNATVKAVPKEGTTAVVQSVQKSVTANQETNLAIPLPKTSGVLNGAQNRMNVPAVVNNHAGQVTVNLSAQSYSNVEVSLYTVNGKRVLHSGITASNVAKKISRGNLVAGAYILSVNGADGSAVTSRLTHSGGSLNINVAVNAENISAVPQLAKKAADGEWTITVGASGYVDSVYTLVPVKGTHDKQTITLRTLPAITTRKWTNLRYASQTSNNDRVLDLTLPSSGNGPFPLVIFIHGGGFTGGSKADVSSTAFNSAPNKGYALASINHRLASSSQVGFPGGLEDILTAIRFLRANADEYHIDPNRFAVTGFSAGGYHTGMVAVLSAAQHDFDNYSLGYPGVSSAVQAAVSWSALTDFMQLDAQQKELGGSWMMSTHYGAGTALSTYFGMTITNPPNSTNEAALRKSNPLNYVNANTPPIMMQHGTNDNLVPWKQSEILVNKINEAKAGNAILDKIQGGGHGGFSGQDNKIFQFLDEKLGVQR